MKVFVEFVGSVFFVDLKLSQNPYMPTTFVRDDSSAVSLFTLLDQFSTFSGLKINKSKTEGLWLGR